MEFSADLLQIPGPVNPTDAVFRRAELLESLGFDFGLIGHVLVLPAYHPLDVAEQIGTLEQISDGRAIVGVGVGYREYEYTAMQKEYSKRGELMTKRLEALHAVWRNETSLYLGTHVGFTDVTLVPRPVQTPHPPIWVGAMSKVSARRAGRLADGIIVGLMESLGELQPIINAFLSAAENAGRNGIVRLRRTFRHRIES